MKVIETDLPGCLVIEPRVFGDDRGFFFESFNHDRLREHGLQPAFVQGNVSSSVRGVLRGGSSVPNSAVPVLASTGSPGLSASIEAWSS